jgi:hypothetical protein
MTANELADELDKMIPALPLTVLIKSATMLRQQQAEIEKLKQHWSEPQTDLIVLLREEVTLMQQYLEWQNLREHFVAWRQNDCK